MESNNLPTKLALPYHPRSSLINNLIYLLLLVFDARIYKPIEILTNYISYNFIKLATRGKPLSHRNRHDNGLRHEIAK